MPFRMKTLTTAFALLVTGQSFAADLRFSFREIHLGDTVTQVEAQARLQFEHVQVNNMPGGSATVTAGNTEGLRSIWTCPIAAPSHLRANCLHATFSTRREGAIDKVQFIRATQSFNPPVPLDGFLKRFGETYGAPRATYKDTRNTAQSGATEARTFLWGGTNIPATYSQSAIPWDDSMLIGGRFVSIHVNINGTDVIGYELRIADTDKIQKAAEEDRLKRKGDAERAKQKNAENVKF